MWTVLVYVQAIMISMQLPELLQSSSYQLTSSVRETLTRQLQQHLLHYPGLHINLYDVQTHTCTATPFTLTHTCML